MKLNKHARLAIAAVTLVAALSSSGSAFAIGCMARPDNTAQECAETCAWAAAGGSLGYLLCF